MSGKNRRAVDKTPLNTPRNTTVLSSIRLNGDCAYTVYQGGTTAEYLKTKLLPTLSEADIIVMDNVRSHHSKSGETATGQFKSNLSVFTPI